MRTFDVDWLPMTTLARALRTCAAFVALLPAAVADDSGEARWKVWREDLDYLYEEIEKPSSLDRILDDKGIEWKRVKKEADARFKDAAKAAKKRRKDDELADQVEFYGILDFVVGQLRDSHAYVRAADGVREAWQASKPPRFQAGIEFLSGAHDTILVANTFAARGANSPLNAKGVRHEATVLRAVNGTPAAEFFEERARRKHEEEGWQSTYGRAWVEALNGLDMGEGEKLELEFATLDSSEREIDKYLALPRAQREKAYRKLDWKTRDVSLRANECTQSRNGRNFRFLALEMPELTETSDPEIRYGRLPSGLGYVWWLGVSGKSRAGMAEACEALADCPGLVVDMRLNGGGGHSATDAFDRSEGEWAKPVAVLVGPKAMSQAETELWNLLRMREGHRVELRVFGERTAGSSGDKVRFELPSGFASGQFVVRHWHGGQSTIEGRGIEPDEVVRQDVVELSRGIDSCIRAAEAWIAER